jgi:hypothetical protein
MYDFWSNPRVSAEAILAAHQKSTIGRMGDQEVVLAIQDTTELDYSGHRGKQGLGYLHRSDTKGLLLHNVLCVSSEGIPYGLLHQQVWARSGRKTQKQHRTTMGKESHRWLESLAMTEKVIPKKNRVVTIADREADIYELMTMPRRAGSDYLIRVSRERLVKVDPLGEEQSLKKLLYQTRPQGYLKLKLQKTPRRRERETLLSVQWVSVWLQPPVSHPQREQLSPIKVQVLWAVEEECPIEETTVNWMLVTTLPIEDFESACKYLRWYSWRWLVERYHFVLKSGCRLEQLQLRSFERLKRAIATFAIVAWRLLWLTYLARLKLATPIEEVFSVSQWQTLYRHQYPKRVLPMRPPELKECMQWLAKLGGFIGRNSDGEPGVKTIWRGLRRLKDLLYRAIGA